MPFLRAALLKKKQRPEPDELLPPVVVVVEEEPEELYEDIEPVEIAAEFRKPYGLKTI